MDNKQHALDTAQEKKSENTGKTDLPEDVEYALEMLRQMEVFKKESDMEEYKNSLLSSELLSKKTFEDLNLPENVIKALRAMEFKNPSTIQQNSIPEIASGSDVAFQSHSGSGKTIAFLSGALSVIDKDVKSPQVIIVTPTRDLSKQIHAVLERFSTFVEFTSLLALPEVFERHSLPNVDQQILIGSPGTLKRLISTMGETRIKMVILDEADALLQDDMGAQTVSVVRKIKDKQLVLFSATFSAKMKTVISTLSKNIKTHYLQTDNIKPDNITQFYMDVPENRKSEVLLKLYGLITVGQSIIFIHTREKAARVQETLKSDGFDSELLHGQLTKEQRDSVIEQFKKGAVKVLVTTNVLSRGLDVPQLNLAVNYDIPRTQTGAVDIETYVHRIGRTGRFNRAGVSITFVGGERDRMDLHTIQREVKSPIKYITLEALKTAITEKLKE
ncbi:ATP-dependent RNA helicase DDX19/DBP5 [Nematocida major]|uniref:ATP-dependent RNA helicase DDX19/DBP5 n=1 Tax=Nematocida major TaxID=1912982 RepID=UPI002007EA1F|nr:ATP-dependent RNA helicase DDX19/DBP5 [Nematocida major]KAH9386823.1 ATP-dependent RNA helicase DDX19/DBP5 [Nematocida major]